MKGHAISSFLAPSLHLSSLVLSLSFSLFVTTSSSLFFQVLPVDFGSEEVVEKWKETKEKRQEMAGHKMFD